MKKASILLVALVLALFGLAACGDDEEEDGEDTTAVETTTTETAAAGGGESTLELSAPADGSFAYDQKTATAKAGTVTVNFSNPASLSHDVVIEDQAGEIGKTDLVSEGDTSVTVDLQPGTYTFYCDVPGHREGGMEGTLTVK